MLAQHPQLGHGGESIYAGEQALIVVCIEPLLEAISTPVTPTRVALAPRLTVFMATLPAPPGRSSITSMRTTGTGASGEIQAVVPDQ